MFITKKNKNKIIITCIIILFLFTTNFLKNFYNLIRFDYDQRIVKVYGFCSKESIGYLNYLKKTYKVNQNIKVINYIHAPNVTWTITNPIKINESSNRLILLNYPGPEIKIKLDQNKIDEYVVNNFYFFLDKINNNNYLQINKVKNDKLSKLRLEILIKDSLKNTIKTIEINNSKIFEDRIVFSTNINFEELKNSFVIYFKISGINIKNKNKIFFIANNKYNINNYEIIDNFETCYYLKNR